METEKNEHISFLDLNIVTYWVLDGVSIVT
jgi:hypothetical protein